MALEVGQRVGDYEALALLGSGGMGRVYKVRNIISNREEAMKVLLPDFASEPELAARFMAEIRTLAGLEHPNIAQLRTAFQFEKQFVMIMEFVEGTTLEKLAQSNIPLDQVLDYSTQVLSALSYAHGRGVTHRDIKPANIMVTSHGLVKLMDFGIAKSANDLQLTRPGTTMGSVYYISPEQVGGGTVDARSDIYSFGVTLYEMLTGRKPFQADTSFAVLYSHMHDAPTPPSQVNTALSPELNNIVLRAMQKRPEDRFQSADEFRIALKALRKPKAEQPAGQPQGFAPVAVAAFPAAPQQQGFAAVPLSAIAAASQPQGFAAAPLSATAAASQPQGFTPVPAQAATPAPPQPQGFTPVTPIDTRAAAPARNKSHRGLWIGLGALAAILALVAAATVLPHLFSTRASQNAQTAANAPAPVAPPVAGSTAQPSAPAPDTTQQPNPPSTETPQAGQAASTTAGQPGTAAAPPARPAYAKPRQAAASSPQPTAAVPASAAPIAPAAPAGPSAQEIGQAHEQLMKLEARAEAAQSSVQQMRSQQQAQGLDMRGDILAAMSRMKSYLAEANRHLSQRDIQAANKDMESADQEVSKLESFLGR